MPKAAPPTVRRSLNFNGTAGTDTGTESVSQSCKEVDDQVGPYESYSMSFILQCSK